MITISVITLSGFHRTNIITWKFLESNWKKTRKYFLLKIKHGCLCALYSSLFWLSSRLNRLAFRKIRTKSIPYHYDVITKIIPRFKITLRKACKHCGKYFCLHSIKSLNLQVMQIIRKCLSISLDRAFYSFSKPD